MHCGAYNSGRKTTARKRDDAVESAERGSRVPCFFQFFLLLFFKFFSRFRHGFKSISAARTPRLVAGEYGVYFASDDVLYLIPRRTTVITSIGRFENSTITECPLVVETFLFFSNALYAVFFFSSFDSVLYTRLLVHSINQKAFDFLRIK